MDDLPYIVFAACPDIEDGILATGDDCISFSLMIITPSSAVNIPSG